jgi:hypothetical protein
MVGDLRWGRSRVRNHRFDDRFWLRYWPVAGLTVPRAVAHDILCRFGALVHLDHGLKLRRGRIRLRRPIDGATQHEVHVRDAAHGLIVWAAAVVIGTSLATFSLSSAVTTLSLSSAIKGSVDVAKSGANAIASSGAPNADPFGYEVDVLLRSDGGAAATKIAAEATGGSGTFEASRREVSRILTTAAVNGILSSDDRAYLAHVVSARAGVDQPEAEKRVDALSEKMKTSADKERATIETARKMGIILAFLTAASMVLGAAAAWWGASVGGLHRDGKFDASHLIRW